MLMKLTPAVNFIYVICTHFLYERRFSSFFQLCLALNEFSYEKRW